MTRRQVGALLLVLVTACAETTRFAAPRSPLVVARDGHGYDVDVVERGAVPARPVPVGKEEFQRAIQQMARDVRMDASPPEVARKVLEVGLEGDWLAEVYNGEVFTLVPLDEKTSLTSVEDEALRGKYLGFCAKRGGGDCLSLFTDGPFLRVDDRRTLALALAFDSVLDETREAVARELLDPRAVVSTLLWMAGLYLAMWVMPEPATKVVAAVLTVALVGWLGLDTLHGLFDGWARLAHQAHRARTFEELQVAGNQYAKVMGKETARALVMVVMAAMGGQTAQLGRRLRALPGYVRSLAQAEAQGVRMAALGEVEAAAAASDGSLVVIMDGRGTAAEARAMAALMDEGAGLTEEALAAKLSELEAATLGSRLPADISLLERLQPSLEHLPASLAEGNVLWSRYVTYFGKRLAALKEAALKGTRALTAPERRELRPPRTWRSYLKVFKDFARGVTYQRAQVARLRADAVLPRAQRTWLKDFEQPRIETNVGVNTGEGVRFADILVIEQNVPPGQLPRVEVFSIKSRDFTQITLGQLEAQATADAAAAVRYYGTQVDVRRPSLNLRGQQVPVSKVHLIYDAKLKPRQALVIWSKIENELAELGVEVRFQ